MNDHQTTELEIIDGPNNAIVEQMTRGEIDAQVATAKKYPRDIRKAKKDMEEMATLDEETAQSMFYSLPRGGKVIKGPSVRMAEVAIATYGNIRGGARVINVDTENCVVTVQGVVHDLEKNIAVTVEKRRRIIKKRGAEKPDEDMIMLACNAASSIAFRDAAFKVVPMAFIKPIYERAMKVAVGDVKSFKARRDQVVTKLKQMGALEANIAAVCGKKKVEDITIEDLETLIGLGTALKEGDITLEDAFPDPKNEPVKADLGTDAAKATENPEAEV